jgi:hypothetical protein
MSNTYPKDTTLDALNAVRNLIKETPLEEELRATLDTLLKKAIHSARNDIQLLVTMHDALRYGETLDPRVTKALAKRVLPYF